MAVRGVLRVLHRGDEARRLRQIVRSVAAFERRQDGAIDVQLEVEIPGDLVPEPFVQQRRRPGPLTHSNRARDGVADHEEAVCLEPSPAGDLQSLAGHGEAGDGIGELLEEGELRPCASVHVHEIVRDCQLVRPTQEDEGLPVAIDPIQGTAQPRQPGGGLRQEVETLGDRQQPLKPGEHGIVVAPAHVPGRELQHQGDTRWGRLEVGEFLPGGQEDLEHSVAIESVLSDGTSVRRGRQREPVPSAELPSSVERAERVPLRDLGHEPLQRRLERPLVQIGPLGRTRADGHGVLEERDRLRVRSEPCSAFGSAAERHPGLGGQGVRLGPVGRVALRREVVTGESASKLFGIEGLEVASGGQMADLAVALGERVVGDLADERLDERVLTALGRPRVHLPDKQLPSNERP